MAPKFTTFVVLALTIQMSGSVSAMIYTLHLRAPIIYFLNQDDLLEVLNYGKVFSSQFGIFMLPFRKLMITHKLGARVHPLAIC